MSDTTITLRGYVGADPITRRVGNDQIPVSNFRLGCTPRRVDRQTGEWVDGVTQWYSVSCWRNLADNVSQSVRRGDPVVVHGRLLAREYINKDGIEVTTFEVEASVVGHDMNRAATSIARRPRPLPAQEPRTQDALGDWRPGPAERRDDVTPWATPGVGSGGDPWDDQVAPEPAAVTEPGEPDAEADAA